MADTLDFSDSLQDQMDTLALRLLELQRTYYIEGRSLVSDQEYDRLNDELAALERAHPEKKRPWSPTQRVGSDLSADFPEVRHSVPVLSLDKAYTVDELTAWARKMEKAASRPLVITAEQKMDGVSIVCYYEAGELVRAVTRGNGEVGNDVSANVRTIPTVPLRLPVPATAAVRGEIFLPKKSFEEINKTLAEPYANPRNLAAGSIRRIKSSEVARIPLQVFFYEAFITGGVEPPRTHGEALASLRSWGFPLNPDLGLFCGGPVEGLAVQPLEKLADFVADQTQKRSALEWEIDGLVLKVDDLALREELGYTGHHPRWALAYKFESPQAQTVVEDIFVQVGRTGRVTPVARVQPVQVGGSTVTFVTLHNASFVQSFELGVGDQVAISRRGDVIPAVESVVEKLAPHAWVFPTHCPACASALTADGAHTFCPNPDCPQQVRGRLVFFSAKAQMDMENLGPETIDVLLEKGLVRTPADLFTCDYQRLLDLPGFGEKKVALIEQGVASARQKPYPVVLASLGVPELGKKTVELLLGSGLRRFEDLVAVLKNEPAKLLEIDGIGERTVEVLVKELLNPRLLETVEALKSAGLSFEAEAAVLVDESLAGTSWCVTGSFERFQPRSLAEEEIAKRGGKVVSAVSGKTTHLLAGTGAGSKLDKAQALGVQIVSEADFLALLGL